MLVRAKKLGFNIGRRREGEVFEYAFPKNVKPTKANLPDWVELAPAEAPEGPPKKTRAPKEKPVAMSEMNKGAKKPKDDPQVLSEVAVDEPEGGTEPEFLR